MLLVPQFLASPEECRMIPQRPPGSSVTAATVRLRTTAPTAQSFETLKNRIVTKLEERLDPAASKRMPGSLLRQSLLSAAESITEQEARLLPKPDRDRMVEQVLAELLGYGPLEELFQDTTVREVMVTGPHAVIVRREGGQWSPTNVKFRDEEHVRAALDRLATHADPIGGVTTSVNLFDLKLPNGFRAVAVIPPEALGVSATVAFVRSDTASTVASPQPTVAVPPVPAPRPLSGAVKFPPQAGPGPVPTAGSGLSAAKSHGSSADFDPLALHRKRIIEKLITKMASLGVYDVQRVEVAELRRIVAAYITEYCAKENIYLSDTDQGRLQLEILTAMRR
jgi:pilus assembly protein CpaF